MTREDVPPLVTVRPAAATGAFGPSPYRNQELLLGARVYTLPHLTVLNAVGRDADRSTDRRQGVRVGGKATITARCRAGSEVYLWAPYFVGTARLAGPSAHGLTGRFRADWRPLTKIAAMERLGTVPDSGRLTIELSANRLGVVPDRAVGCLDTDRLHTVVRQLKATGATKVTVSGSGGTIRARLPEGSKGVAVVAAPRIAGWRCAAGDAAAVPAKEYHGLIAVPLDGTSSSVTCNFHPPGLRLGTAVGGGALVALVGLGAFGALRRRRA